MIGERLKSLRKSMKMKQEDLAGILGVTKHSVSLYENNKSSPSDDCYVLLAKTLNVSIDYLMGLIDKPYSYARSEREYKQIPETLPHEIETVIEDFLEYLNAKYGKQ